jgi:hypothetical protein
MLFVVGRLQICRPCSTVHIGLSHGHEKPILPPLEIVASPSPLLFAYKKLVIFPWLVVSVADEGSPKLVFASLWPR